MGLMDNIRDAIARNDQQNKQRMLEEIAARVQTLHSMDGLKVPARYFEDKKFCLDAVKLSAKMYNLLPQEMRKDKEITLQALSTETSHRLSNNMILASDKLNLEKVPAVLSVDQEFIQQAALIHPHYFATVPEKVRENKEVALMAVSSNHKLFDSLSDDLKMDKDVVFATINKIGSYYCGFDKTGKHIAAEVLKLVDTIPENMRPLFKTEIIAEEMTQHLFSHSLKYNKFIQSEQNRNFLVNALSGKQPETLKSHLAAAKAQKENMKNGQDQNKDHSQQER